MIVARDIAHAKLKERLDRGEGMPQYMKDHPVYYAGPRKTPRYAVGFFRADDGGERMDYVDLFESHGGAMITLAKGNGTNRLPTLGKNTAAFIWAQSAVRLRFWLREYQEVEVLEYPEGGVETMWKIEVEISPR